MSKLFLGGVSTDAELSALTTKYQGMNPGDEVTYEDIERIINTAYGTTRFKTVVDRFKRAMFLHHNVELTVIRGVGYRASTAKERLDNGVTRVSRAFKQTRIAAVRVSAIPDSELTALEQSRKTHVQVVLAKVVNATNTAVREIAPPRAINPVKEPQK